MINGVSPVFKEQDIGSLNCNRSFSGKPIVIAGRSFARAVGSHAPSSIIYSGLQGDLLLVSAGLPDYLKSIGGSVTFRVLGDGAILWESDVVRPGAIVSARIPIRGVSKIALEATNAGDGVYGDHACWVDLLVEEERSHE